MRGQATFRLDEETLQVLEQIAESEERTVSYLIRRLVLEALDARKARAREVQDPRAVQPYKEARS